MEPIIVKTVKEAYEVWMKQILNKQLPHIDAIDPDDWNDSILQIQNGNKTSTNEDVIQWRSTFLIWLSGYLSNHNLVKRPK
jgi:hypothetical protein